MAIIELENIRKSYADGNQMHHVLNQLNLSVEPNEFVAILGPSGSGKSTLLAIAGLLLSADEGRIRIAGQDLTGLNQGQWTQKRLELLGFIFQDHQLLSYMKIGDQLELVAKLKGEKDKKKRQEEVKALLADLGIEACYHQYPNQMSGGQKQRVAIAGIIALRPKIIILDEATSMLDPEGRLELIRTVREVKERYGLTVISITHDLEEVSLSDRVILFEKGKATLDLTPRELFSRDDLDEIGLEEPFANRLRSMLHQKGFPVGETYQTEGELEKLLWELL